MYRVAALSLVLATSTFLLTSCFDLDQDAVVGPRPENVSITLTPPDGIVSLQPKAVVFPPDSGLSKEDQEQVKRETENGPCCEFKVNFTYTLPPDQFVEVVQVNFDALGTAERITLPVENRFREPVGGLRSGSVETRVPPQVAARGNFPFRVELVTGIGTRSNTVTSTVTVR